MSDTSSPMPKTKDLKIASNLNKYLISLQEFSKNCSQTPIPIPHLVASSAVISKNKILLLQRASHQFQPLLWELPGGRCEESKDANIIESAVRELWEESGLVAKEILGVVGEYEWLDCGELWKKVVFLVGVDENGTDGVGQPEVKLDPNEQNGFVWASREDVGEDRVGDVELKWTSDQQKGMVNLAFRFFRIH